jgi:hypothetical protein
VLTSAATGGGDPGPPKICEGGNREGVRSSRIAAAREVTPPQADEPWNDRRDISKGPFIQRPKANWLWSTG